MSEIEIFLEQTRHAAHLIISVHLGKELLKKLEQLLTRSVVVDLYVSIHVVDQLETQPFLKNLLFRLIKLGMTVFKLSDKFLDYDLIIYRDFKTIGKLNPGGFVISGENDSLRINQWIRTFTTRSHKVMEYGREDGDINAHFAVSSSVVRKNNSAIIQWEVTNASHVTISGLGDVAVKGKQQIVFLEDTFLKLSASNGAQVKSKGVFVSVLKDFQIDYDLQFLNPITKEFVSLENAISYPGVYGIIKGSRLRLSWTAMLADKVEVKPFGISETTGHHEFCINDAIEITIEANWHNVLCSERILVYEFPIPITTRAFEPFLPKVSYEITLSDYASEAIHYLESTGLTHLRVNTNSFRERIFNEEGKIIRRFKSLDFSSFYGDHSIQSLKDLILKRLSDYYHQDKRVQPIINSIKKYYE